MTSVPSRGAAWGHAISAWLLSRTLVLVSLKLGREIVDHLGARPPLPLKQGLHGWDADWYTKIATKGYDALDAEALRFFPLLPLLGRFVNWMSPAHGSQGVVIVANIAALLFFVRLYRFVERETSDRRTAEIAVWIAAIAPPAFVLVMGYAESLMMLGAVCALDSARQRRWWRAAGWAFLAGLARPTGVLLVVPLGLEAVAALRRRPMSTRRPRRDWQLRVIAAVIAAPAGIGSYLWWARERSGSWLEPLRIHNRSNLRGGLRNPLAAIWDALGELREGEHLARGMHFFTALALLGLLVVLWRRHVASLFAYGAVSVLLGLSANNLDSLERYSLATVPLVLAAAVAVRRPSLTRIAYVGCGAGLVAMSVLAFTQSGVVP
jgi:hypothetical protein